MARATRADHRLKRKARIRRRIHGTADRPRLCVYKSLHHVYAQVVDDAQGRTIASASTLCAAVRERGVGNTVDGARAVGAIVAERGRAAGIREVVWEEPGR